MSKNTTLNKKLQSYSALAGATLAGVAASGQVVYTDIDDVIIDEPGEYFNLDVNNDGINDFIFKYVDEAVYEFYYGEVTYGKWIKGPLVSSYGKYNSVLGNSWTKGMGLARVFEDSTIIHKKASSSYQRGVFRALYGEALNGNMYDEYPIGDFDSVLNKYIGLRFYDNNWDHNAWVRVDVIPNNDDTQFTLRIKDFAYNKIPGSQIPAGFGANMETLRPPTNIVAKDSTDTYTAEDCFVSFDASLSDTLATNYGVIAVKSSKADAVTLDMLIEAEGGDDVSIAAEDSSSYETFLKLGMLDLDGDPVIVGQPYKIMVYIYDEDGFYQASWAFSNEITLSSSNDLASNVTIEDIGNKSDASDLRVSFTKAEDETNIDEYRIMIVGSNNLGNFDSLAAANAIAGRYTSITPDGTNHIDTLDSGMLEYNGSSIQQGNYYHACVVSVLKSGAGFKIGPPSGMIKLSVPAPKISLSVKDIGDNGDGTDIEMLFSTPAYDSVFNYIRFVLLPKGIADEWSEERIENTSAFEYHYKWEIDSLGDFDTLQLDPYVYDATGQYVEEGITYSIFPVVTSGTHTSSNTVSDPAVFTLTSPIGSLDEVFAINIDDKYTPSDWKVIMNKAVKETHVAEYRIIAVKAENAGSFNLAAAEAVASGNYVSVAPDSSNIAEVMPADLKDADGDDIDRETEYQFFVLAIKNSKAPANVLSTASNAVSLIKVSDIDNQFADASKIYYSNGEIHIITPDRTKDANILLSGIDGRVILNDILPRGEETIGAANLQSGIYIVSIISEKGSFSKKLLIK